MIDQKESYWFDYVSGEYVFSAAPLTNEQALRFIPQYPAAQQLFKLYRENRGLSILEAMVEVLTACLGDK